MDHIISYSNVEDGEPDVVASVSGNGMVSKVGFRKGFADVLLCTFKTLFTWICFGSGIIWKA
jgi:hypothetical protein